MLFRSVSRGDDSEQLQGYGGPGGQVYHDLIGEVADRQQRIRNDRGGRVACVVDEQTGAGGHGRVGVDIIGDQVTTGGVYGKHSAVAVGLDIRGQLLAVRQGDQNANK